MHPLVSAETHVAPLVLGSSRPQIIADDQLNQWVVKSINSFQGPLGGNGSRLLFNEYVATRIAQESGMPILPVAAISISQHFLNLYPQLMTPPFGGFTPGIHFASLYKAGYSLSDFVQSGQVDLIKTKTTNSPEANAVMVFDTWACNSDRAFDEYQIAPNGILTMGRHIENHGNLLFETLGPGLFRMLMIDHGLAFNGDWHDDPSKDPRYKIGNWWLVMRGHLDIFFKFGWANLGDCTSWVANITALTLQQIQSVISEVPLPWMVGISNTELNSLATYLHIRSSQLNAAISQSFHTVERFALARP